MTAAANTENFRQYKSRFSLIVELILTFDSSSNILREKKNNVSKFQINCVTMFYAIKYSESDSQTHFIAISLNGSIKNYTQIACIQVTATGLEPTTTQFVNEQSGKQPSLVRSIQASLTKRMSVHLRTKWLWVRDPLQ